LHEVEETLACCCGVVTKASRDKFFPAEAEIALRARLYDQWDAYVLDAAREAARLVTRGKDKAEQAANVLNDALSGFKPTLVKENIETAFIAGKKQAGTGVARRKTVKDAFFGLIFGMTESHAIEALLQQLTLSAGEFYDAEMTESVRAEILSWYEGGLDRQQLADRFEKLVTDRLLSSGSAGTLPKSYFDGLAEHYIVKSRNFGSIYQADSLGVKQYRIQGVLDHRTSKICRPLITSGRLFELVPTKEKMHDMLKERNITTLKKKYPFLKDPGDAKNPIPPLHWRCRSWMEYVI
jgi:hypothetical protein